MGEGPVSDIPKLIEMVEARFGKVGSAIASLILLVLAVAILIWGCEFIFTHAVRPIFQTLAQWVIPPLKAKLPNGPDGPGEPQTPVVATVAAAPVASKVAKPSLKMARAKRRSAGNQTSGAAEEPLNQPPPPLADCPPGTGICIRGGSNIHADHNTCVGRSHCIDAGNVTDGTYTNTLSLPAPQ